MTETLPGQHPGGRRFAVGDPDEPLVSLEKVRPADLDEAPLEGEVLDRDFDDEDPPGVIWGVVDSPAFQLAVEHGRYVAIGVVVVARRAWENRTGARFERMFRAAEAMGNHEAALDWEERAAEWRRDRHQRRMDFIELPARALAVAPKAAVATVGGLGAVGGLLALATHDVSEIVAPFMWVADVTEFVVVLVTVLWLPVALVAPLVALLTLWGIGWRHDARGDARWLGTAADPDMDVQIDETTIARALEALRIPQITAYLKEGLPLQYITPCRTEGRGTHAVIRLPAGVAAGRIAKRRPDLSTGLYRRAQEVWITTGDEEGILDLWIADKGALADGAGPYPLLESGKVDVFHGVPFGRTLRGEPLKAPIIGRNTITGGMPDQGKSSVARIIMLGCALDPTVEERIWVPDTNFDFEAFKPRCAEYVMGADDEHFRRICEGLEDLVTEIQIRGDLLVRHQQEQVTRKLASEGIGLHPIVALLEEAHLQFSHKVYGERSAAAAENITRLGRKRGIHLIVSTQATTGGSVPVGVTINCANGICFAVARHQENDAILGQGAYSAGHRATDLIPGVDKGNAVVRGFTGERSAVAQAYYVSPSKGQDQVTPIIDRALAEIRRQGRSVPGTDRARPAIESRNLLDDLDEVLGPERVRLADVPALLRDLAPHWAPYRTLTGQALKELLDAEDVPTTNTGNVRRLDPAALRAVLAERSTADLDDEG